jgi:hypothetical protein
MKDVEETAKATQEVAKLGSKAIEASEKLGSFFGKIMGPAFEELGGAFQDWAASVRHRNALRLVDRIEAIHQQRRLEGKTTAIPARLAIPLIQNATLEDDETLSDMWAGLIANATDPNRRSEPRRTFVTLLSQLEPLDARLLFCIYKDEREFPERHPRGEIGLRNESVPRRNAEWLSGELGLSSEVILLSLESLGRLELIEDILPLGGGGILVPVNHPYAELGVTHTGKMLIEICSTD